VLAIPPIWRIRWTNRNEIIVGDGAQLVWSKCHQRLGPTRSRDELDADRLRPVNLDHRAEVAAAQSVSRDVVGQDDDIERMNTHFTPPG
jgi:hypothetical protein